MARWRVAGFAGMLALTLSAAHAMPPETGAPPAANQANDIEIPALPEAPDSSQPPANPIDLQPPGERQFVLDTAGLISESDEQRIRQTADRLLADKAVPVIIVTIESMAKHGGAGMRIETFAQQVFDQWGIGPERVGGRSANLGILLLISRDDHRGRIELGDGCGTPGMATPSPSWTGKSSPGSGRGIFQAASRRGSPHWTGWPAACSRSQGRRRCSHREWSRIPSHRVAPHC